MLKITFLRSPVDRLLSLFEYVRAQGGPASREWDELGIRTITDLVAAGIGFDGQTRRLGSSVDVTAVLRRFIDGEVGAAEAFDETKEGSLLRPTTRNELALAKQRLNRIEFVGITEAFDDSLRLFAHLIKLEGSLPSYQSNAAPAARRASRGTRYTADELSRVAEANRADQELYDHAVELFCRRYELIFGGPPSLSRRNATEGPRPERSPSDRGRITLE